MQQGSYTELRISLCDLREETGTLMKISICSLDDLVPKENQNEFPLCKIKNPGSVKQNNT